MGRRGRNRDKRNEIMALIEADKPELYEELLALRSVDPASYRKKLRYWVQYYPISTPQKVMANRAAKYKGHQLDQLEDLDKPFQQLRNGIRKGNFDELLDQLEANEKKGRDRPLIYQLIRERREAIDAPPHGRPPLPGGDGSAWRTGGTPDDAS